MKGHKVLQPPSSSETALHLLGAVAWDIFPSVPELCSSYEELNIILFCSRTELVLHVLGALLASQGFGLLFSEMRYISGLSPLQCLSPGSCFGYEILSEHSVSTVGKAKPGPRKARVIGMVFLSHQVIVRT